MRLRLVLAFLCLTVVTATASAGNYASSFRKAKEIAREQIYFDQNRGRSGSVYCGCDWEWKGESGGPVDWASCGYQVRAQEHRAVRTEWEHIVPAWLLGHQRQCWQVGGRKNCVATDPLFHDMHVDLHNLTISIGEVNADRSNYRMLPASGEPPRHGACPSRVSFKDRQFEPRDASKGLVARVYFYMHDRYGLPMSRQQERVMMAWNRQYPVTRWEVERAQRIDAVQGTRNDFVLDSRDWAAGYKPRGEGLRGTGLKSGNKLSPQSEEPVIGNTNSDIYHLPGGVCPSYNRVAERNREYFPTEAAAAAAGYRKAGNCG
jgi:deoxyribonuclease-1